MTADEDRKKALGPSQVTMEDTELYKLLVEATEESMKKSLSVIDSLSRQDINLKSKKNGNTYLHILVQVLSKHFLIIHLYHALTISLLYTKNEL